jgi:hypothetical protein
LSGILRKMIGMEEGGVDDIGDVGSAGLAGLAI